MYVCMYACMFVCSYVCMYAYESIEYMYSYNILDGFLPCFDLQNKSIKFPDFKILKYIAFLFSLFISLYSLLLLSTKESLWLQTVQCMHATAVIQNRFFKRNIQ